MKFSHLLILPRSFKKFSIIIHLFVSFFACCFVILLFTPQLYLLGSLWLVIKNCIWITCTFYRVMCYTYQENVMGLYGNNKSENGTHSNSLRINHISLAFCKLVNYKCICWSSHLKMQIFNLLGKKSTLMRLVAK